MENTKKQPTCKKCGRALTMGEDVIGRQQGVIGPRGFVPLEDMELLCADGCAEESDEKQRPAPYHMDRRIP